MNEKSRLKVIDEFMLDQDLPLDLDDLMMVLAEAFRLIAKAYSCYKNVL